MYYIKCSITIFHLGKQILKIYDGNDAVKRNQYRLITVPRISKNEEVVVREPVIVTHFYVS